MVDRKTLWISALWLLSSTSLMGCRHTDATAKQNWQVYPLFGGSQSPLAKKKSVPAKDVDTDNWAKQFYKQEKSQSYQPALVRPFQATPAGNALPSLTPPTVAAKSSPPLLLQESNTEPSLPAPQVEKPLTDLTPAVSTPLTQRAAKKSITTADDPLPPPVFPPAEPLDQKQDSFSGEALPSPGFPAIPDQPAQKTEGKVSEALPLPAPAGPAKDTGMKAETSTDALPPPVVASWTAAESPAPGKTISPPDDFRGEVKPTSRFAHSEDYRSLTGQVQLWRGTWRLRYADFGVEDAHGGSVLLEGTSLNLQDGKTVRVQGQLIPSPDRLSTPRFQVQSLEVLGN